jgi:hypothetical protein
MINKERLENLTQEVWKKSRDLVQGIYKITHKFPSDEKFGLTNKSLNP